VTIPTQVPEELVAGDTWQWTRSLADYPAGTWTGVYYFKNAIANFSASATQSGTDFAVTVAAATTASKVAGTYRWLLSVTSGGVRKTVEEGWVTIEPDPAAAGNADFRTPARVMLENIEAYLVDPTNLTAASFALAGRSLSRWSRADLLVERDKLLAEVRAEDANARADAGLGNPRRLYVRFDRG